MKKNKLLFLLIFLLLWVPFVTSCDKDENPDPVVETTMYVIHFETMGGTLIESQKVAENRLVKKPKNPVRTGYIFSGWYTDAECQNEFKFDTAKITSNKTLYAKWIEEEAEPTKLDIPVVQISSSGVASWQEIKHATGYLCKINDLELSAIIQSTSVQLENGDSIAVKAVGDDSYLDSDFSKIVTYEKKEDVQPEKPHQHTDNDSDGICDSCKESIIVNLTFFAINDLHGKYIDTASQPGVDELTTYFKQLYADESSYEVVLSSGDMWQGTAESSSNKGALMTQWMSEAGFASMTVGNHEFDWGLSPLSSNQALADFPFLGINVRYRGQQPSYIKSSTTVTCGAVKVGIIGAIGNCLSSISGEHREGLSFVTGNELTALVKAESNRLRTEEDCDLIIYSLHDGFGQSSSSLMQFDSTQFDDGKSHIYYDMELSNGYVDLVFEGHSHQSYMIQDGYGVYHLQGGGENYAISQADITYNTMTQSFVVTPSILEHTIYGSSSIADDPVVEEIFNQYFPDNNPYTTILGFNSAVRYSEDICSQIAKLYLEIGKETWGNNYDIVLGGGYLNTRSPYSLAYGNVTYANIFSLLPFDNEIVLGSISGTNLLNQFINNTSYYCAYDEAILNTIEPSKTYYIVVDTYCSTYSRNGITEVQRLPRYSRDLLSDFIKSGGWNDNSYNTISIAEALEIGNALAENGQTAEAYYISGTVQSIENTTYGNLYLVDGNDTIYVYGCYDQTGQRYDAMAFPPKVGNQIVVYGVIKKFKKGTSYIIELLNVKVIEITG